MDLIKERQTVIAQMEAAGQLDPQCPTCREELYPYYQNEWTPDALGVWCPPHKASERCKSGKRAHCTCDTCF